MAYTDRKLKSKRTTRGKVKDSSQGLDTLRSRDAEKIKAEIRGTKAGAILGAANLLNPATWAFSVPSYAVFRGQGMSREDAAERSFRFTWKVCGAVLLLQPIPVPPVTTVLRGIGATMLALNKPVEDFSKKDITTLKLFARQVANNPELQQQLATTATQLAIRASVEPSSLNEAELTKMAVSTAADVANATQKEAIKAGHVSEKDVANITQTAKIVQKAATTKSSTQAKKQLDKLPPPTKAQLGE